ncbi:MAG: hypothetical protein PUP91_17345 [Rhizonema sp. PD37]|nr:hypothetical protein [Rhizonema sp. PD37]
MQKRKLNDSNLKTGLQVSRLGLGTMNFGELTDETTSFKIIDRH